MKPRSVGLVFFLAFLPLVGTVVIGLGVWDLVTSRRFLANASAADGVVVKVDKVVDYHWTGSGERSRYEKVTLYYPVVRFVTASEQAVEYSDESGSNPPAYGVGDSVRVLYDPANPQKARLDTVSNRWLGPTVAIIIGVVILSVGVAVLLWSRESRRERRGRGGKARRGGGGRRPHPTVPRSGAEPGRPPHGESADDRPQDSKVRDE